jgi:hypothetical protein
MISKISITTTIGAFFLSAVVISLGANASRGGGVGVGNGGQSTFVSSYNFAVEYAAELTVRSKNDGGVIIDNLELAGNDASKASTIEFDVKPSGQAIALGVVNMGTLLKYIQKSQNVGDVKSVTFEGAQGFSSVQASGMSLDAKYFLLTSQGDLVQTSIHAIEYAHGLDLIPPVIETFHVDTTPPTVNLGSFKMSTQSVQAGESLTVSVAASDSGSGMRGDGSDPTWSNQNGYLRVLDPNGKLVDFGWGTYDAASRRVVFTLKVNPYAVGGVYRLTQIFWVADNAGNATDDQDISNFGLNFTVINDNP